MPTTARPILSQSPRVPTKLKNPSGFGQMLPTRKAPISIRTGMTESRSGAIQCFSLENTMDSPASSSSLTDIGRNLSIRWAALHSLAPGIER